MANRRTKWLVVWLAGLFLAPGAQRAGGGNVIPANVLEGQIHAPELPEGLDWLNTPGPLRLADLRGKFVLLDFWTYCCINCMHILPDLRRLETKYSRELVVIGVHSAKFQNERDTAQIREAVMRYDIQHPVVNDSAFEAWRSYAVNAWPTTVLINPLGKIIGTYAGEGVYEPFDAVLAQAIPYFEKKGALKRSPLKLALEQARKANTLLNYPGKISADEAGGRLFITDSNHNRIIVTDEKGKILDVIGGGEQGREDGSFETAQFHHPQGTALAGGILYIADTGNHLVRAADLKTRRVSTVLGTGRQARGGGGGGTRTSVDLNSPWDVLFHSGTLYIAMAGAHQLWAADTASWQTAPYAGSGAEAIVDGAAWQAALAQPSGLATDGRRLFFADSETSSIRQVDLGPAPEVRTIVGKGLFEFGDVDGGENRARLQHPLGVAWRAGKLYVADTYNSRIKVVDPAGRTSTSFAGNGRRGARDGRFQDAAFNEPGGLAWLGGKLYVADTNNHQIRVLDPAVRTVSTLELTGLEKLAARTASRFRGRLVDLGEREVSPAGARLSLNIVLPAGYKFNTDAPFYLRWRAADGSDIGFGLQAESVNVRTAKFPIEVPLVKLGARAEAVIDTVVYYCTSQSSACYVDPIRVKIALKAAPDAPASAPVEIRVRKPGAGE